jgi:transcriptional regulator with XRE-family HTH domain
MSRTRGLKEKETLRSIGRRIRERRIILGISQSALGKELGITFQQVQKYEHGHNGVSSDRIVPLCEILQITPNMLFNTGELIPENKDAFLSVKATKAAHEFTKLPDQVASALFDLIGAIIEIPGDTT